jgi:hypothetical protein
MASLRVVAWKPDPVGFTGWDSYTKSELKRRLRQSVSASPTYLRRLNSAARDKEPFNLESVNDKYVESLRQILETMGAEVVLAFDA